MKTYLDVPFNEKDMAKLLGAKWDHREKRWYAANEEEELIKRWPCSSQEITILNGEDVSYGGTETLR